MNNEYIKNIVGVYLNIFPTEKNNLGVLLNQLENKESIITRRNLFGHVTTSGIVIHENKILLIFHNKLKKYIQPGGHIEDDESLLKSAQREILEETGIETVAHQWHMHNVDIPININTHIIPYSEKKQEPQHFHHDCTFVFKTIDNNITLQVDEVSDYKWLPLDSVFDEMLLNDVSKKILHMKLHTL